MRELRNDPGDIHVLLDLGCLLCDMNRLGEAAEKFRRVLELEPDHGDAHFYLGDVAERQGQLDQAMDEFGVVVRLDEGAESEGGKRPTGPDAPISAARTRLASLLLRRDGADDLDSARSLLRQEFQAFKRRGEKNGKPPPPDAANKLDEGSGTESGSAGATGHIRFTPEDLDFFGRVLLDARMPREARIVLEDLLSARPAENVPPADTLHALSVACFMLGDRAAGVRWARRALRIEPKLTSAMHNIAVACVECRNWRRARLWLARAIATDPDDAALRRLRVKVRVRAAAEFLRGRQKSLKS
jgi:tetratricopeptide (TPR) repeat protein